MEVSGGAAMNIWSGSDLIVYMICLRKMLMGGGRGAVGRGEEVLQFTLTIIVKIVPGSSDFFYPLHKPNQAEWHPVCTNISPTKCWFEVSSAPKDSSSQELLKGSENGVSPPFHPQTLIRNRK